MAKRLEAIPFVRVPVGWMPCVACSDYRTKPGQMWLGYSHGDDLFIECPVCQGTGQVERVRYIDARNGRELDYERPGQHFIQAQTTGRVTAADITAPSRLIITG